jgi:hypothetical protein
VLPVTTKWLPCPMGHLQALFGPVLHLQHLLSIWGLTFRDALGSVFTKLRQHALLLQMTMNLMHNAIVHNLPERGRVVGYDLCLP